MSYNVESHNTKDAVVADLHEEFAGTVNNPSEGASANFELATAFVANFMEATNDDGYFSVSVHGHANGGEGDARDYVSVSINPANDPEPAPVNENVGADEETATE